MNTFLHEAMRRSREAAEERERAVPSEELVECLADDERQRRPDFAAAVSRGGGTVRVIAEVKRTSPSAGDINTTASLGRTSETYEQAGAAAISVLTSEYGFGGHVTDLSEARSGCALPLLCKDFISLEYQVLEALALGASAMLLISEALDTSQIERLARLARQAGAVALVEAHTEAGLERALEAGARVIGINNRDLDSLEVDIATTERLVGLVPDGIVVVSESGIRTRQDVERMEALGVDALLIGEALMRAPDPGQKLKELTDAKQGSGTCLAREQVRR